MYDSAKKGKRIATKRVVVFIDENVYDEFEKYCDDNDYIRPRLIELILEEFLDKWGKPMDSSEDATDLS